MASNGMGGEGIVARPQQGVSGGADGAGVSGQLQAMGRHQTASRGEH